MKDRQPPLEFDAEWTSPKMLRYLELMAKADHLLTWFEALRLSGTITTNAFDRHVALAIRQVTSVPRAAFNLTISLRERANGSAMAPKDGALSAEQEDRRAQVLQADQRIGSSQASPLSVDAIGA